MTPFPAFAILIGANQIRRENVMPALIKPSGPAGAVRAFQPVFGDEEPAQRIAHALEHIAVVLSALDHNVDVLATHLMKR
jgi:hypothetical protein